MNMNRRVERKSANDVPSVLVPARVSALVQPIQQSNASFVPSRFQLSVFYGETGWMPHPMLEPQITIGRQAPVYQHYQSISLSGVSRHISRLHVMIWWLDEEYVPTFAVANLGRRALKIGNHLLPGAGIKNPHVRREDIPVDSVHHVVCGVEIEFTPSMMPRLVISEMVPSNDQYETTTTTTTITN